MKKQIFAIIAAIFFAGIAHAAVAQSGTAKIESELKFVKLDVEAKCQPPRFEDDTARVFFTTESYKEVETYRGYTMKLLGRTCGKSGAQELSADRFEKVQVLMYNYGEVRGQFDDQVRKAVEGL